MRKWPQQALYQMNAAFMQQVLLRNEFSPSNERPLFI